MAIYLSIRVHILVLYICFVHDLDLVNPHRRDRVGVILITCNCMRYRSVGRDYDNCEFD